MEKLDTDVSLSPFCTERTVVQGSVVELYKLPISNRISSDADQLVSACSNEIVYSSRMADSTSLLLR